MLRIRHWHLAEEKLTKAANERAIGSNGTHNQISTNLGKTPTHLTKSMFKQFKNTPFIAFYFLLLVYAFFLPSLSLVVSNCSDGTPANLRLLQANIC